MQSSVTFSPVCPPSSPEKAWKHWVVCSEWSQQACLTRWALKQLEEHANGQTRYYLECERLLALNDTEKLQRAAEDWHRLWSHIDSQSKICRCKKALGEKATLGTLGGVVGGRVCLHGIFSFKDLDYLKSGYWEEPELPNDGISGPGCGGLHCMDKPRNLSSLV